jgi:hypothetical protein
MDPTIANASNNTAQLNLFDAAPPEPPKPKYRMSLSLNILKHLGFNLYSNVPAVLSEAVANAWDADSENVDISLDNDTIVIQDDGSGMTESDINKKFLTVGYAKRHNKAEAITPVHHRAAMGRKGIGKLSLFSLANVVEVHSVKDGQKCALLMSASDIETCFKEDVDGDVVESSTYNPTELDASVVQHEKGTKIILRGLKRKLKNTEAFLRRRIARKFTAIGDTYKFNVKLNGDPITIKDRDFYKDLQFIWFIGDVKDKDAILAECTSLQQHAVVSGVVDAGEGYAMSGWIGSVLSTGKLAEDNGAGETNNKISILARHKVAQDDILSGYGIGGIYAKYLIGEVEAEFLESDDEPDIATSNRQAIIEDDPRYKSLQNELYNVLKRIKRDWNKWRKDGAHEAAKIEFPILDQWYEGLLTVSMKESAKQLFATIQNIHFDQEEDEREQKRELYKQGILAFERLEARKKLDLLSTITSASDIQLAAVFSDLDSIEAVMYHDIASERIAVIQKLVDICDANDRERIIQTHLFNHLWLLNPSWDRATAPEPRMEQRFKSETDEVVAALTEEERNARFDIKYRTAGGKHVIVELKRYNPTYNVSVYRLSEQVGKYKSALRKCLAATGQENEPIEIICVLGKPLTDDKELVQNILGANNARVVYIDQLIAQAQQSYSRYLERQSKLTDLRRVIDSL